MRTLRDDPEVAIIGAGPGGSVAAVALARAGREVILIERAGPGRRKVCGCCLSPAGVRGLEELDLGSTLADAREIETCTIHTRGARARVPATGYRAISREKLDLRLIEAAAKAGAKVLTGAAARVQADRSVVIQHGEDREERRMAPRWIICADGIGGTALADLPEFSWVVTRASRMGVSAMLPRAPVAMMRGDISMLCRQDGYLGLVRLEGDEVDAAAALCPKAMKAAGGPGSLCARIVKSCVPETEERELGLIRDAEYRGTPLLTRRRICIEAGNVLALGDAAGYVEPFTGEGMTWAIESAIAAAGIANAGLAGKDVEGAWTRTQSALLAAHHRRCRLVARCIRHESLMGAGLRTIHTFPKLGHLAARMLGSPERRERRPS